MMKSTDSAPAAAVASPAAGIAAPVAAPAVAAAAPATYWEGIRKSWT